MLVLTAWSWRGCSCFVCFVMVILCVNANYTSAMTTETRIILMIYFSCFLSDTPWGYLPTCFRVCDCFLRFVINGGSWYEETLTLEIKRKYCTLPVKYTRNIRNKYLKSNEKRRNCKVFLRKCKCINPTRKERNANNK